MFERKGGTLLLDAIRVGEVRRVRPGRYEGHSLLPGPDLVDGHDADQTSEDLQAQIAEVVCRLYGALPAHLQRIPASRNERADTLLYFDDKRHRAMEEHDYVDRKWADIYQRLFQSVDAVPREQLDTWLLEAGLTDELGFLITTPPPPPEPPSSEGAGDDDDIPF